MRDILPEDHEFFTLVKKAVRHRCRQAGFVRITTPLVENVGVFQRGIGDGTDIVEKEMFTLKDRNDNLLALRPETTASVMRAFIEHGMNSWPQPVQFYCIEPAFRYDRPQKGRYRQFWQYSVEVIGEKDPSIDAQVILLGRKILEDLQIADRFELQINTIGNLASRKDFENALQNHFAGKSHALCPDCKRRLEKNPLRILDCKNEDCQILSSLAPKFDQFLDQESKDFYQKVLSILRELQIPFVENKSLVRGLDYYCDTVFEFWDKSQGSQNAIGGGGRYDGLCEKLGGSHAPAVGFSFGVERVISHLKEAEIKPPKKDKVHVFVACLGELAKMKAVRILSDLHDLGIHALGAMGKSSIKAQMKMADKLGADWCLILGDIEVKEQTVILKDMKKGEQNPMPESEVLEKILKLVGKEDIDKWEIGE